MTNADCTLTMKDNVYNYIGFPIVFFLNLFAIWLRSSVVSVLFSVTAEMVPRRLIYQVTF